ncbi:sulfurtransferase [Marinobacter persicus]|uniref:Thiosulfate/3-mercaptopyruvate sulfurtransferase n=1 Tax=Marinobacter persicus TaxID=930118 RepID=A0A2S6GA34_9GAMM|nr:sulfurtransferase [Marinobacter persicus]PPK53355.1 thiosulfate/3-mercaptopyruvate sulfurtransferase [Marinobacter persicus]PPK56192.1 thiosulfate/3-mercaptopyruvate sulfurtransferase [Marinobacter persicus]PPK59787.1 thiosulfate/3-mercaptopyruvate sulfurtransferase [Marinobacter persicus]
MVRLIAIALAFVSSLAWAETDTTPPLVDAAWLNTNLDRPDLVVLDVRSGIDNGGDRSSFRNAHIPGSIYSSYTGDGWRESRDGVTGLLPPVASLERLIGGLGIGNDDTVVVVPAGTGVTDFGSAARVYWTFRVLGHDDVTILNGGFAGWRAAGFDVASGQAEHRAFADFRGVLQPELLASLEEVQQARDTQAQLVDARPADYFRGETKSPAAKGPGTIPGSRNLPHSDFLGQQNAVWYLNADQIRERVNRAELDADTRTIAFCNTGHWAATDWFVLSELAGFKEVALYDGSMAEWSNDPERPLQVAKKGLGKLMDLFN